MKLITSGSSPYGRKARMTVIIKGLSDRVEIHQVSPSSPEGAEIRRWNPLKKVPTLILDDGSAVFDSPVVCEYLDTLTPSPRLFPGAGPDRFRVLTLGALCDGIIEATASLDQQRRFWPEEEWKQAWTERHHSKITVGLEHLSREPPSWDSHPCYGCVALAAALGYLDTRGTYPWQEKHPELVAWRQRFAEAVPAHDLTRQFA